MITSYHRPASLDEALEALAQPDTVPLGGGTQINTPAFRDSHNFAVVDLQGAGLDYVNQSGNSLEIGACVTLERMRNHPLVAAALKQALRREAPLNIRNMASVAGTLVAADGRSPLATTMLALDAKLKLVSLRSAETISYGELLPQLRQRLRGQLIQAIRVPLNAALAWEAVSRTPADWPIVSVALARWPGGRLRLALGGFGPEPLLGMDATDAPGLAPAARNAFHDASDEWGSADYRSETAARLAVRCLMELQAGDER